MKKYDIAVIGAGSGGLVAALEANRRGAKVAMLEQKKIGGECTHSGCVPSKSFISSARLYHAMKQAERMGLPQTDVTADFNFAAVMERVDDIVQGIYLHEQPDLFRDMNIDVYIHPSGAQFLNNKEIQIEDEVIEAEHTVISAGSSPRMLPSMRNQPAPFLNNENFWQLRKQPRSIIFLGGGVISVELGQALARFGSTVKIIDRNPRILKVVDEEIGQLATQKLKDEGLQIFTDALVTDCRQQDDGRALISIEQWGGEKQIYAESVFVALGRVPNVDGIQLEKAGVEYSSRGVKTNEYLQTTAENIYACGDVTTPAKFTHVAAFQAEVCVKNILYGNKHVNDLTSLPWAIFTEPEIAHVGLSEAQARERYDQVQVFKVDAKVDRFTVESQTCGFLKVVMDENDKILGADAIGAHAGEWIQFITFAIQNKLPVQSFADTIFIYPTFSEIAKKVFTRFLRTKLKKS
jgi:pyruvate/2-oxoglutarate dehydrogenase complex dihydrolipoamide dehydrogenase (E3) component